MCPFITRCKSYPCALLPPSSPPASPSIPRRRPPSPRALASTSVPSVRARSAAVGPTARLSHPCRTFCPPPCAYGNPASHRVQRLVPSLSPGGFGQNSCRIGFPSRPLRDSFPRKYRELPIRHCNLASASEEVSRTRTGLSPCVHQRLAQMALPGVASQSASSTGTMACVRLSNASIHSSIWLGRPSTVWKSAAEGPQSIRSGRLKCVSRCRLALNCWQPTKSGVEPKRGLSPLRPVSVFGRRRLTRLSQSRSEHLTPRFRADFRTGQLSLCCSSSSPPTVRAPNPAKLLRLHEPRPPTPDPGIVPLRAPGSASDASSGIHPAQLHREKRQTPAPFRLGPPIALTSSSLAAPAPARTLRLPRRPLRNQMRVGGRQPRLHLHPRPGGFPRESPRSYPRSQGARPGLQKSLSSFVILPSTSVP